MIDETGRDGALPGVMVVSDTYPPVVGGAEMDVQRVSAELIRRGYPVQVLCAGGDVMPDQRQWTDPLGVPVLILTEKETGRWKHILFALRVAEQLFKRRRSYDLVYFSMQGLHLASGLLTARACQKKILMKVHGSTVIPLMARSRAGRAELRWLQAWGSRVMLLNDEMIQEALDFGFSRKQLMHMPNPIDVAAFCPLQSSTKADLRVRLGMREDSRVLTYVGRLSHEKGLVELVDGFAVAAKNSPKFELCLVGDGPFRPVVEARASSLGVPADQVHFVGRVPSGEVPLWLQASDAFALVSPNEGFSCALAEAMATGLPAIVSAIPANTQLVQDGVQGFTVPFGDTEALGNAIQVLFSDDTLRQRMGQAAREEIVRNYSLENVVDRYERLFEEVLGR